MQVRCRCITDIGYSGITFYGIKNYRPDFFAHKMRSAQAPCGAWAIMKKFIYVCNVKHYMYSRLLWLKYTC